MNSQNILTNTVLLGTFFPLKVTMGLSTDKKESWVHESVMQKPELIGMQQSGESKQSPLQQKFNRINVTGCATNLTD